MKQRILNRSILTIILLPTACLSAQVPNADVKRLNTVTTLGTLHAYMLENSSYTLRDFIAAVETYKPDLILNEVRPAFPGPAPGSIDGGMEQAIVYAIADHLGAEVVPTDWFDDKLIDESRREEARITSTMEKKIEAASDGYQNDVKSSSILQLNSQVTQNKVRAIHTLQEGFGLKQFRKRNEQICSNIKAALKKHSGRKAIIIYGLDHKYFIDDCVRNLPGQELVEVGAWLSSETLSKYQVPPAVKNVALKNVRASERLLKSRLESGFYSGDFKKRLKHKLGSYPLWVQALQRL